MKFGHTLLSEEQAAPKELQGRFLQYKVLKKMLKRRLLTASSVDSPCAHDQQAIEVEKDFLRLLRAQLKEVDRKFSSDAEAILSHYDIVGGRQTKNPLHTLLTCKLVPRRAQNTEALLKLQQRVFWTKKYAELNSTALRKIAKKRDKLCGGKVGHYFLQACFKGQVAIHAILSLPLLRELGAVEKLLAHQLATTLERQPGKMTVASIQATPTEAEYGHQGATEAQPLASGKLGSEVDAEKDFDCAICMDTLYKPVALECGHIYCARCAISAAVGHDRTVGDVDRLLTTIAAYSAAYASRACPACRSVSHGKDGESVFWQIRRMRQLDRLIQHEFPEEWQRRRQEDLQEQAQLKACRNEKSCLNRLPCCGHRDALSP